MANINYKLASLALLSSVVFISTANANGLIKVSTVTSPNAVSLENLAYEGQEKYDNSLVQEQQQSLERYGPWLTAKGYSENAQELLNYIQDASAHGLNPEAYDLTAILATVTKISQLNSENESFVGGSSELSNSIASHRADIEKQFGEAFTKLANDLGKGATDGNEVQRRMFATLPTVNARDWLNSIASGQTTVSDALDSLMPQDQAYHRLTSHMRQLLAERNFGTVRTLVDPNELAENEFSADDIQRIKLKLMETGELSMGTELTSDWDANAEYALQSFQQRNGIPVSGKADTRTRQALNMGLDEEIRAAALSLERWRWLPRDLGRTHLFINVPDYKVEMRKDERTLLSMATVVGSVKHATPTFSENLKHIVFNPTWNVPRSITNRELIPKERSNPGYLKSRNFDVMRREDDRLIKVNYSDITQADLNAKRFPYVLQQRSGKGNALGRMKFLMPNQWSIYMHDTQAKDLFAHHDRAYSHGCIRLSDPDAMARMLLQEDGLTASQIEAHLARSEIKWLRLTTPVPTHITYMTSWVDEYGTFNRRADVYSYDNALISALESNNTLLSVLNQIPAISMIDGRLPNGS